MKSTGFFGLLPYLSLLSLTSAVPARKHHTIVGPPFNEWATTAVRTMVVENSVIVPQPIPTVVSYFSTITKEYLQKPSPKPPSTTTLTHVTTIAMGDPVKPPPTTIVTTITKELKPPSITTLSHFTTITKELKLPSTTTFSHFTTITKELEPSTAIISYFTTITKELKPEFTTITKELQPPSITTLSYLTTITKELEPGSTTTVSHFTTITKELKPAFATTFSYFTTMTSELKPDYTTITKELKAPSTTTFSYITTITTEMKPPSTTTFSYITTITKELKLPSTTTFSYLTTMTKEVWPEPPPPLSQLTTITKDFLLMSHFTTTLAVPTPQPVVMIDPRQDFSTKKSEISAPAHIVMLDPINLRPVLTTIVSKAATFDTKPTPSPVVVVDPKSFVLATAKANPVVVVDPKDSYTVPDPGVKVVTTLIATPKTDRVVIVDPKDFHPVATEEVELLTSWITKPTSSSIKYATVPITVNKYIMATPIAVARRDDAAEAVVHRRLPPWILHPPSASMNGRATFEEPVTSMSSQEEEEEEEETQGLSSSFASATPTSIYSHYTVYVTNTTETETSHSHATPVRFSTSPHATTEDSSETFPAARPSGFRPVVLYESHHPKNDTASSSKGLQGDGGHDTKTNVSSSSIPYGNGNVTKGGQYPRPDQATTAVTIKNGDTYVRLLSFGKLVRVLFGQQG